MVDFVAVMARLSDEVTAQAMVLILLNSYTRLSCKLGYFPAAYVQYFI